MNPRVREVYPKADYLLEIIFTNSEKKLFDVKPYLDKGDFTELKGYSIFNSVKPFMGSIQWINGLDLGPDTLYLVSKPID